MVTPRRLAAPGGIHRAIKRSLEEVCIIQQITTRTATTAELIVSFADTTADGSSVAD